MAADRYELDRTDPNFEHVRTTGLRTFEIRLESGLYVQVQAHNFAQTDRVLSFITVCPDGRLAVEVFNAGEWRHCKEITTDAQRAAYSEASSHAIMAKVDRDEQDAQKDFLRDVPIPRRRKVS